MRCTLTRVLTFHARHRYHREDWSAAKNAQRFGPFAEPGGHGHLYRFEITVTGPLDPETSMMLDLTAFDAWLDEAIRRPLDGRLLNDCIPEFATGRSLPTCEALASWCWHRVAGGLTPPLRLVAVRVAEDETLWADCSAPPEAPPSVA